MRSARLGDGRVHLQDGPIDVILKAEGPGHEAAERAAVAAFEGVLARLVEELPLLRRPIADSPPEVSGPVARRMVAAVTPYADRFVTPMAAVAGAVADHLLAAMRDAAPDLARAWVNDGGDIAFHLAEGQVFDVGLVAELRSPVLAGTASIAQGDPVRGVATSGRGGRSLSLGIADAVTVLACDAAAADAAATLIANAVDLPDHPGIRRGPATDQDPDSDLGDRPVVLEVPHLTREEADRAIQAGVRAADAIVNTALASGVIVFLQGRWRAVGKTIPAARIMLVRDRN